MGSDALLLLAIMFGGSLVLWVGVPLAWLWVASQVQAATDSLGAAIAVGLIGVLISVVALVVGLARLNDVYREHQAQRGFEETGLFALEAVLAVSATIAVVGFSIWFFLFSASPPLP